MWKNVTNRNEEHFSVVSHVRMRKDILLWIFVRQERLPAAICYVVSAN